jgi:diguanylate cyclase (GGDEF)-like protein
VNFGIATKSALVLSFVGALAAGATGFYAYQASRALLVDSVQGELLTATQVLARRVTQARQEVSRNLQILASQAEAVTMLERSDMKSADRMADLFKSVMAANPGYFQIRLISAADHGLERVRVDRDGNTLIRVGSADLQEKGHYPYVYETLALPAGTTYLSRLVINHEVGAHGALGLPTAQMATPVTSPRGENLGLVVISVDLNGVFDLLRTDLPEGFQLFLANGDGDFLIHPDPAMSFGFDKGRRFFVFDEFPASRALVDGQANEIVTEAATGRYADRPVVAAFIAQQVKAASGEGRVILGLAQPRDSVVKMADRLGEVTLKIVVGLTFLCIVIALILGRLVTRSINSFSAAVQSFTGTNTIEGLPLRRQDEIGILARSFDRMQHQIRQQLAELELHRRELQQLAYHDPLTGLPNRRLLLDRLAQVLASSRRHQRPGALLLLDLDNFKALNDSYGHEAGDQLLMEVAHRLTSQLRQGDTVARLGGDEFVLILEDIGDAGNLSVATEQAEIVADKLQRILAEPYTITVRTDTGGREHRHACTSSIGIALFGNAPISSEELLKRADTAMYQAKAAGRNALRIFASENQPLVHAH